MVTRQISAENPDGSKGGAARRVPDPSDPDLPHSAAIDLGRGWKVRPFINLRAGETKELVDRGVRDDYHLWLTSDLLSSAP